MRPKLEGVVSERVIHLVNDKYTHLTPTKLIEKLIHEHYESIYPAEVMNNDTTSKTATTQ